MKNDINHPAASKINWTALVMATVGLLIGFDVLPPDVEEPLTQVVLIVGPALIATFRTWFTT